MARFSEALPFEGESLFYDNEEYLLLEIWFHPRAINGWKLESVERMLAQGVIFQVVEQMQPWTMRMMGIARLPGFGEVEVWEEFLVKKT
jgi:hypothetical protein